MSLAMEKVEKRLTDLSGALAHNYPEIKLHVILQVASVWLRLLFRHRTDVRCERESLLPP